MVLEWIAIIGVLVFVAVRVVINLQDRPSTEKSGADEVPRGDLAGSNRNQ
ncbi:hypothetical protein SAMN06265360_102186 [Haloechinothrix alba]|uniref:Uncharacterized protein n=1 Tax=Haloechinothrix alba TaxID=664784 RepID=A0A238VF69_9PSEU|nr:hypothetical protein [Haloechinothrix alba]SNR33042.1 hypothetical protein SAMN06265360_102186 [Haloechinothrix alba]